MEGEKSIDERVDVYMALAMATSYTGQELVQEANSGIESTEEKKITYLAMQRKMW